MRAPVTPGELRHTVAIQHLVTQGQDGHGQPVKSWVTVDTIEAKVEPITGRFVEYARQLYHLATYRVTMRYSPHATVSSRLLFGGKILSVGHASNIEERNIWHVLLCSEGADDGS